MDGRSLNPRSLAIAGLRALLLITLALLLVFVYALSGRAAPQSEEVPDTKSSARVFADVQTIPAMALVTTAASAVAAQQISPQEPAIVQALIAMLGDTMPALREAAARALGDRAAAAAVPALITALSDPDRRVRSRAAEALGDIADDSAIPALAQALTTDTNRDVAEEAARALGDIGTPEAATRLEGALLSASLRDEPFRRVVIQSLGRTGQPSAVEMLSGFLPVADRRLQETILEALADANTPASAAALLRLMQGTDANLRLMAARALSGN
jgi:HEAT repeat protein